MIAAPPSAGSLQVSVSLLPFTAMSSSVGVPGGATGVVCGVAHHAWLIVGWPVPWFAATSTAYDTSLSSPVRVHWCTSGCRSSQSSSVTSPPAQTV
jgi:hypothetical protein